MQCRTGRRHRISKAIGCMRGVVCGRSGQTASRYGTSLLVYQWPKARARGRSASPLKGRSSLTLLSPRRPRHSRCPRRALHLHRTSSCLQHSTSSHASPTPPNLRTSPAITPLSYFFLLISHYTNQFHPTRHAKHPPSPRSLPYPSIHHRPPSPPARARHTVL